MADDPRLSCGRSIDDVWSHVDGPPDEHERDCPYCLEARARLLRLSAATADLRVAAAADPALQPSAALATSVMEVVRAEVRRGQTIPLQAGDVPGLTISEQAVVGLVWVAADEVPGVRASRCRLRPVPDADPLGPTVVDLELTVAVAPDSSVPLVTAQLREQIGEQLAAEVGLRVRRVDIAAEDLL